jgi:LuxR family transcriptional activator of bioluminescence operon
MSTEAGRPSEGLIFASYPSSWRLLYRQKSYQHSDPVIVHGRRALLPYRWGSNQHLNAIGPRERELFLEARDHRIGEGFTIPVHGPYGEFGLFSVANRGGLPNPLDPSTAIYQGLMTVAPFVHAYGMMTENENHPQGRDIALTDRECVCLRWTSQGKTAWEISRIIGRSKPTIEYHLQKAMRKLGASNKAHAATIAMNRGLI